MFDFIQYAFADSIAIDTYEVQGHWDMWKLQKIHISILDNLHNHQGIILLPNM